MKILSLFDGMSVAQQALKNIGADVEVYYASEIDEYAMAVTQSNFPKTIQLGSVTDLYDYRLITNDIDLLIGGSPCQDLSIAKKGREGLKGSRSGLFWEYVRIRDEVKPKYFILENVNSMPKEAKGTISEALGVQPVMINASLVSAQNRKRLFWVGKRVDVKPFKGYNKQGDFVCSATTTTSTTYETFHIVQPEDEGILLKDIIETGENMVYQDTYKRMEGKPREHTGKCFTLTSAMGTGGGHVPYVINTNIINPDIKVNHQIIENTLGGYSCKKCGEWCTDITWLVGSFCYQKEKQIRKLTPTECLRLQSMPDDYFDKATYKNKPISNTQRYKMCGNAFNCKVIEHILKHLK